MCYVTKSASLCARTKYGTLAEIEARIICAPLQGRCYAPCSVLPCTR